MTNIWIYSLASVFIVSLISLVGILTISIKVEKLKKFLIYMISFSAGGLFGDAFLHLLPHLAQEQAFTLQASILILGGIVMSFIVEKVIHWQHCHLPITEEHVHPFAYMNLIGDSIHNLLDGLIIGASYIVSIPVGIATTIAVIFHEIPQEIGDFGVLIHGGFTKNKALLFNFLVSLTAVLGVIIALLLDQYVEHLTHFLIPLAIGGFIYIAGTDLIPELHKECAVSKSLMQLLTFLMGVGVMFLLLLIE